MFPIRDHNPSGQTPFVTYALVAINVLVFLGYFISLSEWQLGDFFMTWGLVPARFMSGDGLETLFTSMFLHGGWLHVLGNLWTLAIFGDNVEDRMGHVRFLAFYLVCGVVAGGAHVYFHPDSTVPTIGASGSIAGVMGAYFVLYPRARVITLIPLLFYPLFVELPAFVFLGLWFTSQLLSGTAALTTPEAAGGIAFLAHVGGFAAGLLLHWLFLQRERR